MLKAILVDDEILALNLLEAMLIGTGEVEVIGKFLNSVEGLEYVKTLQPDVLFLDMEMPNLNGIKIAEQLTEIDSQVEIVFVTAYDQYALEAFAVQAFDYILKPIEMNRLRKTVQRLQKRRNPLLPSSNSSALLKAKFFGSFLLIDQRNEAIKWRTKKVKELCALLIHQSEPVHREKIIEELWPDRLLDKATEMLHISVYHLRKELKTRGFHESIKYVDERYSLLMTLDSDVLEVEKILNQPHATAIDVKNLLSLYKNHYLMEEDYYWSIDKRSQLVKKVIQFLEKFIATINFETDSLLKEAIEKLIEMDPLEESYTIELVQFHINQGSYRAALEAYNSYKSIIWEQLGIMPKEKLEQLIKTIK